MHWLKESVEDQGVLKNLLNKADMMKAVVWFSVWRPPRQNHEEKAWEGIEKILKQKLPVFCEGNSSEQWNIVKLSPSDLQFVRKKSRSFLASRFHIR